MSDKYPVTVVITTYDRGDGERTEIATECINGFVNKLLYPNLKFIISDNNSPKHAEHIEKITQPLLDNNIEFEVLNVVGGGVGRSKNTALKKAFEISNLTFLSEDDWLLSEPLDLLPHVQLMLDHPDICMIRYGFLGGAMTARYVGYEYPLDFWWLQRNSGLYVYSGQLSLRSNILYSTIGWHKEDVDAGNEELDMCHRFNNTEHDLKILWPAKFGCTIDSSPFKNIGMGVSLNGVIA